MRARMIGWFTWLQKWRHYHCIKWRWGWYAYIFNLLCICQALMGLILSQINWNLNYSILSAPFYIGCNLKQCSYVKLKLKWIKGFINQGLYPVMTPKMLIVSEKQHWNFLYCSSCCRNLKYVFVLDQLLSHLQLLELGCVLCWQPFHVPVQLLKKPSHLRHIISVTLIILSLLYF